MKGYRDVEIWRNGKWERDEFPNLKEGDIFLLFNGKELVRHPSGDKKMIALSNPYMLNNEWLIDCL